MTIASILGCARKEPRRRHGADFYPTQDHDATEALIHAYRARLAALGVIWEPFAGKGDMVIPLRLAGFTVAASDVVDRGGVEDIVIGDFFQMVAAMGKGIVSNPPFGSQAPFKVIKAAIRWGIDFVALLLPVGYFCADSRWALFELWEPTGIHPLMFRPDFTGEGRPTQLMQWFVWDRQATGFQFLPLRRPRIRIEAEQRTYPLFDMEQPQ